MGHHFGFFRSRNGYGLPEDERLRLFIRKNRKIILFVMGMGVVFALILALFAILLLFKIIIPALFGVASSGTAQSGFYLIKDWLSQLTATVPMQWLELLLQAR